jgi:transposase InsO family protein
MPWKVSHVMEERFRWISEWKDGEHSITSLCRKYGISRKTAYKWIERYEEQGVAGLTDAPRAAHSHPNQVADEIEQAIVELRGQRPSWGAGKLRGWLLRHKPGLAWPAESTMGTILQRHHLIGPVKRRRHAQPSAQPLAHAVAPNDVWCLDFKGWFVCGDGQRCDPLTLTDAASRYLLCCRSVDETDGEHVRPVLVEAFQSYGLPDRIRTDNGPPFASPGVSGLTALSVWWLKLGILPERIAPGKPQQNGRHERMHRTLKQETAMPPSADLRAQQQTFDRFRHDYNQERPHEALQNKTPSDHYRRSERMYPNQLAEMEYPSEYETRRADQLGKVRWKQARFRVGSPLAHELIGMENLADGLWKIWFGREVLGILDERRHTSAARKKRNGYWPPLQSASGLITRQPDHPG